MEQSEISRQEDWFNQILQARPVGVRIDQMNTSPVGPFDVIFANGLVVYRRPELHGSKRMDYRTGGPTELAILANQIEETD